MFAGHIGVALAVGRVERRVNVGVFAASALLLDFVLWLFILLGWESVSIPADFAATTPAEIEPYIRSLGFFRTKARAVHESMRAIVERHAGEVPRTMDELLALRGVARKTANVVLGTYLGINDGVVVDTHVQRLSRRLGLAPQGATVEAIERRLKA